MSISATLRECHRLRKHLKALQEEIDRGPRVLKAQQARLAQEQQAHKDHHEAITRLKLKQREDEGTLKQTETRLAKLEQQLTGISVSKEYEAKESEIRQAKEKRSALEDAILAAMGELEEKTAAIPAVEKQWADAQAAFAQYQEDAKARLERLKADQVESQAALATAEATLPEKVRQTYDFLTKAKGPDALAAVKDKNCQGCRTGMTDQKEMEVRGGAFVLCASCGRMLYPAE
jgi:predicted  nucleic acid-binding Zn-ribbon protein